MSGSNPYLAVQASRANAYLSLRRIAQVAALLAGGALLLSGGLGAGLYQCSTSSSVVPYIVRVDEAGRTLGIDPATAAADPDRAMVEHSIRLWLISARSVTSDRAAQRRMIQDAYAYSGGRAISLLNDWYQARSPFAMQGRTVTSEITSYLRLGEDDDSYQLEWVEVHRGASGIETHREAWRALVTVAVEVPQDLERRLSNPLGIRVINFDWTRVQRIESEPS